LNKNICLTPKFEKNKNLYKYKKNESILKNRKILNSSQSKRNIIKTIKMSVSETKLKPTDNIDK